MALFLASESARVLRGLAGILEPEDGQRRAQGKEYRIDDLARAAGVSVRNVRVYQDRGLLPPPRRQGRTGWYSESHLARLNLIARMLDRGYTFATISELLTAAQYGMRVEEVLGAEDVDAAGYPAVQTGTSVTADDLHQFFADTDTDADALIDQAVANGLLKDEGDGIYRISSVQLLDAARLLANAGVSMEAIIDQAGAVRQDLIDVADRFVRLVRDRYLPESGELLDPDEKTIVEIADLVKRAKATVRDVVDSLLADAMDEAIASALGQTAERM